MIDYFTCKAVPCYFLVCILIWMLQVRTSEVCGTSVDELRNFEYSCLGEVRILGALKHSCIVEMYGHRMSCKWVPSVNGSPEHRILKSAIFLEYIEGGSLKVNFYS